MALGGTMHRVAVLLLLVIGACSPAAQMLHQVQMTGVSYDTGPSRAKLTMTRTYRGASTVQAEYPAIVFYVQGYKSTEAHPPNARRAANVMAAIAADREKHEAERNAVQSVVSSPNWRCPSCIADRARPGGPGS